MGGHWLNMDPFGATFGTLRLYLVPIWNVLVAFLVSLGVILETLGRPNATQSAPECPLDSQGEFLKRFMTPFAWILLQLNVFERSSKVVFLDYAIVVRFQ